MNDDEVDTAPQMDELIEPKDTEQKEAPEEQPEREEQEFTQEKQVPLSALQKERKKRQEAELKAQWLEEQQNKKTAVDAEPDNSRYESATREDLSMSEAKIIRKVEERKWIKDNEEKFEKVQSELEEFLNQRPHLRSAINDAPNRYEEAYTLMTALNPKTQTRQQPVKGAAQKTAPISTARMPKSSSMGEGVDVMTMSDTEFKAWRQSKKRGR
jgi:hypothetical protein